MRGVKLDDTGLRVPRVWGSCRAPRATVHPTTHDIAWAAGIFEGEGYCGVHKDKTRRLQGTSKAVITQKDRWLLLRLGELFGGNVSKQTHHGAHDWIVYGPRARGFLMTIYQFLSPRRQGQVKHALAANFLPVPG